MEMTAVKLKTSENGELVIPAELMRQVGLSPQTEVKAHIDLLTLVELREGLS